MTLVWLLLAAGTAVAQAREPDLTLHGRVMDAEAQTYREVPFTVPAEVTRLTVAFSYTGREKKTAIDLGVLDGERFRGWSGGNKGGFTISETDATPSYLPGVIRPGVWRLLLGIPNIEKGVTSEFEAKIYFAHAGDQAAVSTFLDRPLRSGKAWYRGDFHMHDAHSDGSCLSQAGLKVPCPLYKTVEVAAARKLDFIAISDHNTISQYDDERELQPYFDRLLLIPAREITTFHGHANVFGTTDFIDFRLGTAEVPDGSAIGRQVAALQGILSINHPGAPTGASCMGCGWNVTGMDYGLVTAVEAINGSSMDGPGSGVAFWEARLREGYRLTGIGGSDNHDADLAATVRSAIGHPVTVVYAEELSERAILDGVRAGHVFVDLDGTIDRGMEFSATAGAKTARMGDFLTVAKGEMVWFTVRLEHMPGAVVEVVHDEPGTVGVDAGGMGFGYRSDGGRHWFRVNVRAGAGGRLLLLGNPIYLNY